MNVSFIPKHKIWIWLLALWTCATFSLFAYGQNQDAPADEDDVLVLQEETDKKPAPPTTTKKPEMAITPEIETERPLENYQIFYDQWRNFQDAYNSGNTEGANQAIAGILDLKMKKGILRLTGLALSAISYGHQKLQQNPAEALQMFKTAENLDPTLPEAHYGQSSAHLATGIGGIFSAIGAGLHGFKAPGKSVSGEAYYKAKLVFLIVATLVVLGAAFALILLMKYNALLRHEAEEKFGGKFPASLIHLFVWILLFFPLILFWGPFWLAPFWLMLLSKYGTRIEKILAFFFLAVFVLVSPVYLRILHLSETSMDPVLAIFTNAYEEGPSPRAIQDLNQFVNDHPENEDASILLAYLHSSDERYQEAIDILQKHVTTFPSDSRATNNLAVIYFKQGATDYALRLSQKAAEMESRNALYKFNLSNLYRAKFNFQDARTYMEEARSIDPSLVQRLVATSHERTAEAVPSLEEIQRKMKKSVPPLPNLLVNPFSILAGSLFFITAVIHFSSRRQPVARECSKCGTPFCRRCQPNTKVAGFCTQCLHIFVKKDGVSPASRKDKMQEIEVYNRRQGLYTRISSLLLPGSGSLYQDGTLGIVFLLFWSFALVLLLFTRKFAGLSLYEPAYGIKIISLMCVIFLVLVYLVANLLSLKKPKTT